MSSTPELTKVLLGQDTLPYAQGRLASIPEHLQDAYARESAARELGNLPSPPAFVFAALLRTAIADQEPNVREASLRAFAKLGPPTLVGCLTEAISFDPDSSIRIASLEVASQYCPERFFDIAHRLLQDPEDDVADSARSLLNRPL